MKFALSLRLSSQIMNYGLGKLRNEFVIKFAKIPIINNGIKYPNIYMTKIKIYIFIYSFLKKKI